VSQDPLNPLMSSAELDGILDELKSFGIADTEDIITMEIRGKKVQLRLATISDDDDMFAQSRSADYKGYMWVQRMRAEILARAITWMNGVQLSLIPYSTDPYTGEQRDTKLILADVLMKWGQQATLALWKCYMVHCQKIENNLIDQLPDSALQTEAEQRFLNRIQEELVAASALAIAETAELAATGSTGEDQE
jgi:hypothetical protein